MISRMSQISGVDLFPKVALARSINNSRMRPAARCILAARRFTWVGVVSTVINISAPAQIVPTGFRRSWRIEAESQLASERLSDRARQGSAASAIPMSCHRTSAAELVSIAISYSFLSFANLSVCRYYFGAHPPASQVSTSALEKVDSILLRKG